MGRHLCRSVTATEVRVPGCRNWVPFRDSDRGEVPLPSAVTEEGAHVHLKGFGTVGAVALIDDGCLHIGQFRRAGSGRRAFVDVCIRHGTSWNGVLDDLSMPGSSHQRVRLTPAVAGSAATRRSSVTLRAGLPYPELDLHTA